MTPRVREILSWYGADNPGTLTNLTRLLNQGRLGGTGKMLILPVDQGFEHGPARSFSPNPDANNPHYLFELAIEAGCSAYAAPLGFLEAGARDFAGEIPLILKLNNSDSLYKPKENPISAVTASVDEALRLGCVGIGFTIYPGSTERKAMYEEIAVLSEEAKQKGLVVVIWAYPRGGSLSTAGETAVDVVAYAAQISAQLGAHIIKVKPPSTHIEQKANAEALKKANINLKDLSQSVRYVIESCFDGRRIVIFSGGATKSDEEVFEEVRSLSMGGAFGSIMGRNAFQRSRSESVQFLQKVMDIYTEN